jgi:hypothetical protein
MAIHGTPLVVVHAHSAAVATENEPEPPVAGCD